MQETWVQSLNWEDPLEKGKASHYSILAWSFTIQSMGSQRGRHDWATIKKKEKTKTLKIQYIRSAVFHSFGLSVISLMVPNFWWSWTFFPSKKTTASSFYTLCNRKSGLSCPGSFQKLTLLHPCGGAPGHCPEGSASVLLLTPKRQTEPPCRTQFSRFLFWKIKHIFFFWEAQSAALSSSQSSPPFSVMSGIFSSWPFTLSFNTSLLDRGSPSLSGKNNLRAGLCLSSSMVKRNAEK